MNEGLVNPVILPVHMVCPFQKRNILTKQRRPVADQSHRVCIKRATLNFSSLLKSQSGTRDKMESNEGYTKGV